MSTDNTALTMFSKNQIPAYAQEFFDEDANIADRVTVPSLLPGGKMWTVSLEGKKNVLTRKNEDGDEENIQTIKMIILGFNKDRGRAYYEGAYDPDKAGSPLCYSEDGKTPNPHAKEVQADTCATCPMSVKGSKVNEQGKAVTACSQHRMAVVTFANKLTFPPLRLKLAITSDWDDNPELAAKGWFSFSKYIDHLRANGVKHSAGVVTKMKFDPSAEYPKVIFSPERWLEQDELETLKPIVKGEAVAKLLSGDYTPAGGDGVDTTADEPFETEDVPAKKEPAKPAPKAAAKKEPAKPAPKAAPKKAAPPEDADDGDIDLDFGDSDSDKPAAKAETKAAKTPAATVVENDDVPDDLKDLLGDFDL